MTLADSVVLVAGATRGAGRGIARALGEAGATVYCTGRSSRSKPGDADRPETIEDTADLVTAAGGRGIGVCVDHSDEGAVAALMERIATEHGRLDVLVNSIWGGDALTEWARPFWECDVQQGIAMMERAIHTHLITARHGVPLLQNSERGVLVEMTDGAFYGYRGQLYYDLCKMSVIRIAYACAVELADSSVSAVAVTPGFMRSEAVLSHFGVDESNWRDAIAQDPHFAHSETPMFVGRAIAALASDPAVKHRSGAVLSSWALAREYGFTDVDGRQPHWDEHLDDAIDSILSAESPSDADVMLLRMRRNQLDFDDARAVQRDRIDAYLLNR